MLEWNLRKWRTLCPAAPDDRAPLRVLKTKELKGEPGSPTDMPLSHYIQSVPLDNDPSQVLLYSTRKASLIQLPAKTFSGLKTGKVPASLLEPLTRFGFWVSDLEAERAEVQDIPAAINRLNPGVRASVILGMACNFACTYCYEGSLKGPEAMNNSVADQVILFLQKRFRLGKKKMVLDFYGGEPLLYVDRIKYLTKSLQPFVQESGGNFAFTMVTNGSLLTRRTVEELLPLGLKSVKITLDGPPDTHNQSRPFKNGQESFATILKNIRDCSGLVRINLSGNFTPENFQLFPTLLDILAAQGLTPDTLALVKFDAVMAVGDAFGPSEFHGGCTSTSEPWLIEASLMLRREIMQRGYTYPKLGPSTCMVTMTDAMTIDWDGSLYKCVTLIGHPDSTTGDVWQENGAPLDFYHPNHWRNNKHCPDCIYLPLCFGGCRYSEYQRGGSMAGVDCQKTYFDQALPEMLRQEVKYRASLPKST